MEILSLASPVDVRIFPLGRFELFDIGGLRIGRAAYRPGWRWSEHIGPEVGTALCEAAHIGLVTFGRAAVQMADGTELEIGEGDLFSIPPGHDSWVLGDQDYVSLHFLGADGYARVDSAIPAQRLDAGPLEPIGKQNVPRLAAGEGCRAWSLLDRPGLHITMEEMSAGSSEIRHFHQSTEQFYFVLDGEATVDVAGRRAVARTGQGVDIAPGAAHLIRNDSAHALEFLVISSGRPVQDRIEISASE